MKLDHIGIRSEIKLEIDPGKQPLVSELWAVRGHCDELKLGKEEASFIELSSVDD